MAMIEIETGAKHLGVPTETVEAWIKQGLLPVQVRDVTPPAGTTGVLVRQRFIDDDELRQVAESLGWLEIAGSGWDGPEE
jgi:hypothetical protein